MKSTLSDNKQLFNVKAIAGANLTPENIPANTFGVVDEATGKTVAVTTFAALPDKFRFISKLGGKVYTSFDDIDKNKIVNKAAQDYQAPQINIWEGLIEHCDCINGFALQINIEDQEFIQRDGLHWGNKDFVVDVSPQEISCKCDGQNPVYENNVITSLLFNKVNAMNSDYYEAEVRNADNNALINDPDALTATNKDDNTDGDPLTDGPMFKLVIKTKIQPTPDYNDLEIDYIYPRGTRIHPAIVINGYTAIDFTETQEMQYEVGAGYDLRAEEFDCMSLYTDLNNYPQLPDGIKNPKLKYQFENDTNYKVVNFEFDSPKTNRAGTADQKRFAVTLATDDAGIFSTLSTAFGA